MKRQLYDWYNYNFSDDFKTFVNQSLRFVLVGVLNTIIGAGLFSLLYYFFKFHYLPSNIISTLIALINSFICNKLWTFKKKEFQKREVVLFIIVFAVSFGIQNAILIFLNEKCGMKGFPPYVIASVIYTIIGFLGNKYMSFRR